MRIRHWLTLLTLCTVALLSPLPSAGQTEVGANSDTPRTNWGDPDLQGTWSYASLTPLERPAALANREFFTPEEAAARNQYLGQERWDNPPRPGTTGNYNSFWMEFGQVSPGRRTSLIVNPADGRLPLATHIDDRRWDGLRKIQDSYTEPADSWLDINYSGRCITFHGVPPLSSAYNNAFQIVQVPGYVAILSEMSHDVRIIPVDGRPPLDGRIRQWNGSSRGHWEGETLVVETTNFSDPTHRFPSSQNTRAVERFRRIDANTLEHQFTIEDATLYTQPWTAARLIPRVADYVIYEFACHEGNRGVASVLRGSRRADRESHAP